MDFKGRDFISISDFSRDEIEHVFKTADRMAKEDVSSLCRGKILATLFYEPSTRTMLSFVSSMYRLGGTTLGFSDPSCTSVKKGESIADTARTMENYADIIVMRHSIEGAAKTAADYVKIPVINAGDGAHQHPTQTVLDLYTILKEKGKISGLKVALCGDLKYGRTVHSLAHALALFGNDMVFVAPNQLAMPHYIKGDIEKNYGVQVSEIDDLSKALDCDVIYMTRIQKERFADPTEYERIRHTCLMTREAAEKTDALIMHPLPRVNEIEYSVDELPRAAYFRQMGYGVPVRMALLSLLLGATK